MNKVATTIRSGHIAHRIHSMSRHMGSHLKAKFAHKYSTLKRESVFSMLPNELVMYIMEFLSLEDLCAALSVCQQWQAMGYAYNEHLWKMQCMSYWDNFLNRGELSTVLAEKSEDEQWEQFFTRKYNQEKQWKGAKFTQTTLAGHIGTVWSLGFDDKKLVTGSFDKTVKIWDRKTYKCIRTLRGHAYPIQCLQFQDNMLITGSLDNTIRVWDTDTGEFMGALATNAHNFDVFCLQFQGDRLISGSSDSTIRVWNMVSLECEQTLRHSSCVTCLQFDESRLVTGSADKFLKLWDLNAGVPVSILVGHLESVRCLQFTGNALISGSNDHTIKIWDLRSLKCAMTLRGHAGGVRCLQFHGSSLLSGSADRTIKLWDLRNAQPSMGHSPPSSPGGSNSPGDVILSHGTSVACLQWDGYTLAAGFSDAKVKVCSF